MISSVEDYGCNVSQPKSLQKPTPKQSKPHNSSTYSLPPVIGRLHNAPPLRPVSLLTDALLRRPIRQASRNVISGKLHAIVVGEDTYGVDLAEAGAEVDGDGVVGGIKFDAIVLVDAGFVVGGGAGAVGVVVGTDPRVFGEGGGREEGEEEGVVVHDGKGEIVVTVKAFEDLGIWHVCGS